MPSSEKTLPLRAASEVSDFSPDFISSHWKAVEACLREVFKKSDSEAQDAVLKMRHRVSELSQQAALLVYHDSPLQTAATLAGAADRGLTPEELLAWEKILNSRRNDRPSRDDILKARTEPPRFG
jgi:hypothetical protein